MSIKGRPYASSIAPLALLVATVAARAEVRPIGQNTVWASVDQRLVAYYPLDGV